MAKQAPKEDAQDDLRVDLKEKYGLSTARSKIQAFKNRRCYPIEPFSLALAIGQIDPITGLPGLPQGSIVEVAGPNGVGKTLTFEHTAKHVLADDPNNKIVVLFFEPPNSIRMEGLESQGLDLDRIYQIDYSRVEKGFELATAEKGLNLFLTIAGEDPDVKVAVIDSIGAMPVRKEVMDDKGEFIGVDKTPQMAVRATILTRFINQWLTLDQNTRPTLFLINHMKEALEVGGFGLDPMKVNQIGENLNYPTPGGAALKFAEDIRIKINARKIEMLEAQKPLKHPLFGSNIQTGLDIRFDVYKNKFCGDQGSRRAIGRFDFATKSFDIVDEVLSYAAYLGVNDIVKGSTGYYEGVVEGKKLKLSMAQEYYKENPDKLDDLKRQIALRSNELFSYKEKGKKTNADKEL